MKLLLLFASLATWPFASLATAVDPVACLRHIASKFEAHEAVWATESAETLWQDAQRQLDVSCGGFSVAFAHEAHPNMTWLLTQRHSLALPSPQEPEAKEETEDQHDQNREASEADVGVVVWPTLPNIVMMFAAVAGAVVLMALGAYPRQ